MGHKTIDLLLERLTRDAPVMQVLVGAFWTAVVLQGDADYCGLATTMGGDHASHARGPAVPEAGTLVGRAGRELAGWLRSETSLKASMGMAAYNALLAMDEEIAGGRELNAEQVIIQRGAGRRVAVVGHFPFVERVRPVARQTWVLELAPRPGDVPAERANEILPQADVVAMTGTSLLNHTFDDLIALCRPETFVLLLGPSAPLTPALFDVGVDAISGTRVVDAQRVLASVGQGATFRQIKRRGGVRLLTAMRNGNGINIGID